MYLDPNSKYVPSIDSIIEIWIKRLPGFTGFLDSTPPLPLGKWLIQIFNDPKTALLQDTSRSIFEFVNRNLSHLEERRFLSSETFWSSLLGKDVFDGEKTISLDSVYHRLSRFNKHLLTNPHDRIKEAEGCIWLDSDHSERQGILLGISSQFPSYLQNLLVTCYKYAYLDDIALDPGVSLLRSFRLSCKSENKSLHQQHPPTIKGIDLKDSTGNLLGTVMQIDNCLSPSFVQEYINSMNQSTFTQDRVYPKHDRGYRFACSEHMHDGVHPSWLLFGQDSSSSLLLSQHTNSAKSSLLQVINFVQHLYVEFVSQRMEQTMGKIATEKWGLINQKTTNGHFDSLMTMISNPANSNYGLHEDGKPGLFIADTTIDGEDVPNKNSKFNMVVPTLAIQNHTKETTKVHFYDKSAPKTPIGTVTCSVVTIHLQLIGVQHNCYHEVSTFILFDP